MRNKQYINELEGRARDYSKKNKALKESVALLREEILQLKSEVLQHATCGFGPIEKYSARCVDDLLNSHRHALLREKSRTQSLVIVTVSPSELLRVPNADLPPKRWSKSFSIRMLTVLDKINDLNT